VDKYDYEKDIELRRYNELYRPARNWLQAYETLKVGLTSEQAEAIRDALVRDGILPPLPPKPKPLVIHIPEPDEP
jgi:hypothetical protein